MRHYVMAEILLVIMAIIGNAMNGVDGVIGMLIGYIAIMIGIATVTLTYIMTWCVYHKEFDKFKEEKDGDQEL